MNYYICKEDARSAMKALSLHTEDFEGDPSWPAPDGEKLKAVGTTERQPLVNYPRLWVACREDGQWVIVHNQDKFEELLSEGAEGWRLISAEAAKTLCPALGAH
jgi:hypothetical protein